MSRRQPSKLTGICLNLWSLLSQSLDDLGTTLGECLGRTRWSSPLDWTTYLYYFTSGCTPIITWSHVLPEHSLITWSCHVICLLDLPCYLYLDSIIWLDVRDQIFKCMGNSFLPGALITERILNKRWIRGKDKYLVCWKGFTVESDTWEGKENLKNTKEAIEEFKKEYR